MMRNKRMQLQVKRLRCIFIANFKKQAESIAKNNKFPNPWGSINIPWATKSSPWGSRLIAQGEFMGKR